jgi:hypothetical protein
MLRTANSEDIQAFPPYNIIDAAKRKCVRKGKINYRKYQR